MNIDDLFTKPKHTVWDDPVPIITSESGDITAYISDQIDEAFVYNELCHKLRHAPVGSTATIHLNTPGGYLHSAMMLIDAIKSSKATTVAHLTGTVASAGTIIALSCDELIVSEHLSFMIHNYSGGISGKGHEMKAQQEFSDKNLNTAFNDFYAGFLTPEEMVNIIDGKDMWLTSEETRIRWARRKVLLEETTPFETPVEVIETKRKGRPKKSQ